MFLLFMQTSILRYHRELRGGLGEGWIQSLRTELEPEVKRLLGEDWKEVAEKYIHRQEEKKRDVLILPKKEEKEKEIQKVKI